MTNLPFLPAVQWSAGLCEHMTLPMYDLEMGTI